MITNLRFDLIKFIKTLTLHFTPNQLNRQLKKRNKNGLIARKNHVIDYESLMILDVIFHRDSLREKKKHQDLHDTTKKTLKIL